MKKTTVYLLRDNLASYLTEVERTEIPLVIYKFKKPIAIVIPVKNKNVKENYSQYFGFLKGKEKGIEYENRVRRNKKEREYIQKLQKEIT